LVKIGDDVGRHDDGVTCNWMLQIVTTRDDEVPVLRQGPMSNCGSTEIYASDGAACLLATTAVSITVGYEDGL